MRQKMLESESSGVKTKPAIPPPPPLPRFWIGKTITESVTKQEIAKFWIRKRFEEEDHLLAAIKAAARIRARNLMEEDYQRYEESLKDADGETKANNSSAPINNEKQSEVRIGIKDWWTKSKYAYLNQPAIESNDASRAKRRASAYAPNCFHYKPTPLYPTSLGVY
ncbi:hypothetical protein HS088_TW01G00994 [Tripterygium wilfordii]|uniref:Uncharacterized protein n=1 Tax=Tripterygium wilfordii TaxID=458696 RepID=A0A7J7E481_TRIWF|nr:uncharacterized protein LOC120000361 [Tripterygium wilfordii]XP_038704450.1 uncharacterized protein LOC120000361 [Tripterygium wilfordii]KAF5753076.1 hypothetical protein HS088_TW01G00994 [Tripterygium wilfordii]